MVTETAETLGIEHKAVRFVLNQAAGYLWHRAELASAVALMERALAIDEARLGPDHPDTARSQEQLAATVAALENRQ